MDNHILREIFLLKRIDFFNRFNPDEYLNVLYVTDLIYCSNKYHLRYRFPELALEVAIKPKVLIGDLIHRGLASILKKDNIEFERPIELTLSLGNVNVVVKGRIDMIDYNTNTIYEFKYSSYYEEPPDHYVLQVNIYQEMLKRIDNKIYNGKLVILNDEGVFEHNVKYEEIDIDKLVLQTINNLRSPKSWECQYCPYNIICPRKED